MQAQSNCVVCGCPLTPRKQGGGRPRKYCDECRPYGRPTEPKPCENCGATCERTGCKPRKFCKTCLPFDSGTPEYLARWRELRSFDRSTYARQWRERNREKVQAYNSERRKPDAHDFGERTCRICGVLYTAKMPNQENCSRECYGKCIRECAYCGNHVIKPKSSKRYLNAYCDDTCKGLHYSQLRTPRPLPVGPVPRHGVSQPITPPTSRTFYCGTGVGCGEWCVTTSLHRSCDCDACQSEKRYVSRKAGKAKRRRRMMENGRVDRIYRRKVFERNGWRCQECRRKLNPRDKVPNPRAATVDHIIPLALGGTHTYDNVQCLCFACNSKKGARVKQLSFGV